MKQAYFESDQIGSVPKCEGGGPRLPRCGLGVPPASSPAGFFFCLFALYLVYVYHNLLCDRIRVAANHDQGKVRNDTVADQFHRLNQKQQEDMKKYKSTLMEPAKTKLFLYSCTI